MKSPLTYERLARGEIPADLNESDAATLKRMQDEDQAFLARHPSLPPVHRPRRLWLPASVVAAAAVLLVVGFGPLVAPGTPDTRIKSADQSLFVYHKTPTGTELLGSTARLGQDDEIQVAYFTAKKRFATILSVDSRGAVTNHLPLHSRQALEVETPKPELLPYSYRLDDAPDFETLYLITSEKPFDVTKLHPFLRAFVTEHEAALALPAGFAYTAFRIAKKETR